MSNDLKKSRILICSYVFWPSLGGLELTSEKLAFWLSNKGYEVEVITFTNLRKYEERKDFNFKVIRSPNPLQQLEIFSRNDIIISKHLALRCCWPILFSQKKILLWHATWYKLSENIINKKLRKLIMRKAINIANSKPIAEHLDFSDAIVHPGFAEEIFENKIEWSERQGFIYLGRLSSEKGCDLLLQALVKIPDQKLSIIGDGEKKADLEKLCHTLGLSSRVQFLGKMYPQDCVQQLNKARVLVVPSLYEEPFGTVALEGLAAGCRVVVSSGGGLQEAAGPTGIVFQSGDINCLVQAMEDALNMPITQNEIDQRNFHLRENTFDMIAQQLMSLLPNN